ncbi:2-oxoacid:acceptor oxidoreductase family protein [Leptospirillum ferrooxidans]|jgi:pyruvate ferredoxin oxidoreductase gamma subunit|uniref:Ferredoxin oxidoreductase, gamma subunit n=1 Tax=Leptospirillum ferrooxidans (strain C2-3) TaxID=1162668 RepID=I0IRW0_LEPFC|nr:2-oxoacid:acceptor oxidoreductase family protein [Leptospirillum ferrooxidans]BAM08009.1 ferredoxin oxidoreductase, gamma subunit [Leptospirillum ferrooxidans C2-3]
MNKERYNIRMAGIGGQGVVTASHILSNGMVIMGGESTLVPFFGSEKRLAPVESYVRIANGKIYEIGEIIYPNLIMIFHPQVITHGKSYTMPFYSGLKPNGVVLINSETPINLVADEERELMERNARVYYLPATQLSREIADTDLATNMAMVGAVSAIMGIPDLPSLEQSVKERFLGKGFVVSGGTAALDNVIERKFAKKEQLLKKNMEVIVAAYNFAVERGWAKVKEKVQV